MQKFVILSGSRSGTSLVSQTLNTHRDIVCHGEVFHRRPASHLRGTLQGTTSQEVEAMRALPTYLDRVYDQPGAAAVGFKMWNDQSPEMAAKLMADEGVYKIIFERTNILARFTSSRLVKATGIYNRHQSDPWSDNDKAQTIFDRDAWDKYQLIHRRVFKLYRDHAKGPVLEFSYERLLSEGFDSIQAFLGVDQVDLAFQKKKLYGANILDRFSESSQADVLALLDEIDRSEWIHEPKLEDN